MKHYLVFLFPLMGTIGTGLATTSNLLLHCASISQLPTAQRLCHTSEQSSSEVISTVDQHLPDILVDTNEHDPTPYYPWTHKPTCHISAQNDVPNLCIYTNASFSNGRGISIFTTPSLAKEFSQLQAFTDPSALSQANTKLTARRTHVRAVPNKGMGRLASRDLKRGELVSANTPLLLVYREDVLSTVDREFFLRRGIEQLNRQSRALYESMAKIYGDERVKTQDVLKANTFGLHVGGMEHMAVWPEPARCNHACGPNAQYRMDPDTLIHYVYVARNIAKDEEITLAYINPFDSYHRRQDQSSGAFHFSCDCARCQNSAKSDINLAIINNLEQLLSEWEPTSKTQIGTPEHAERLILLYKEEGLDGFLDVPYGHATLAYNAVGDVKNARVYARLARLAVELKDGVGVGDWNLWKRMEVAPKEHWSWRKRKV